MNIQPAKPLPPDLQQLIDSSGDEGVIIVSFGSIVSGVLDKETVDIMAEAFGRLKQKVIWRLQGRNTHGALQGGIRLPRMLWKVGLPKVFCKMGLPTVLCKVWLWLVKLQNDDIRNISKTRN